MNSGLVKKLVLSKPRLDLKGEKNIITKMKRNLTERRKKEQLYRVAIVVRVSGVRQRIASFLNGYRTIILVFIIMKIVMYD